MTDNNICFVNLHIMGLFECEQITEAYLRLNTVLQLLRMYKSQDDQDTVGYVVSVKHDVEPSTTEYRWHLTFDEAYKFYHNYDLDLDDSKRI